MLSLVITYHDEGQSFLQECLDQIKGSIDVPDYEIIVIHDCSRIPLLGIEGVKIIRNPQNLGVGGSFDVGVSQSLGEDIILTACDMRFIPNNWVSKLVKEINDHPKSLICTACVGMNREHPDNMIFEKRRLRLRCYGATIIMFHDQKSNPRKEPQFRGIIEAKWHPFDKSSPDKSYEIPCILGACYGVKKEWYQYLDGFALHKVWGTLEPYLSLKSYMFGGNCIVAPHIETAHIFKREGTHGIQQEDLIYNKMMVATVLLEDYQRFIDFLGTGVIAVRAKKIYDARKEVIFAKREQYKPKIVYSYRDFCHRFNIDLRDEPTV